MITGHELPVRLLLVKRSRVVPDTVKRMPPVCAVCTAKFEHSAGTESVGT